jgi:hypothetical protein
MAVCDQLAANFASAQDDRIRGGLGLMLVDLAFYILARGRPQAVVAICDPISSRLQRLGPWYQAVAAGALFYSAQARARLGQNDDANHDISAMRQIGAPALDALDRIAEQFGPREFNRSWHLQIDILRVAILAAVGRLDEARTLRSEVMTRAAQQDAPAELVAGLASIEAELTDASDP